MEPRPRRFGVNGLPVRKAPRGRPFGAARRSGAADAGDHAGAHPETPGAAAVPQRHRIVSAAFGVVSLAAAVLAGAMWSAHAREQHTLKNQINAVQAAVHWTGAMINLNSGNLDTGLEQLRDDTAGDLKNSFDASMVPFRDALRMLRPHSHGHLKSVSIEHLHRDLGGPADVAPPDPPGNPPAAHAPPSATVLIVATSVGDDAHGTPETIEWNLRIGVTDVDGRSLVSQVEAIR